MNGRDPLRGLFPLDSGDGPATRLTAEQNHAILERATNAVLSQGFPGHSGPSKTPIDLSMTVLSGTALIAGIVAVSLATQVWFDAPPAQREPLGSHAIAVPAATGTDTPSQPPRTESPQHATTAEPRRSASAPESVTEVPRPRPTATEPISATDLLAEANRLRGEEDWHAAEQTYRAVVSRHPSGQASYAALIAAASLRLNRLENPRGALAFYRRAARRAGPLDDQVWAGVAQALERLGQTQEARAAWSRLLAAHPDSPLIERGRQRLRELGNP